MKYITGLICLLFPITDLLASDSSDHKGEFYIAWGWNTSKYSRSDYHFKGDNYDFVLSKVKAKDKPYGFDPSVHLNPSKLTLPQTNFRLGYFINNKFSIAFGFDHMKYVMVQDQLSTITGTIENTGTEYDGIYDNRELILDESLLEYEHTDGLNYLYLELNRHISLFQHENKSNKVNTSFEVIAGVSAGMMMPRTAAHLLNYRRNNSYHITGFGTGVKVAGKFTFLRHFFVQPEIKGGWIDMPRVRATSNNNDYVSQNFLYRQFTIMLGGNFRFGNSKKD